jgi:hypothetical protein
MTLPVLVNTLDIVVLKTRTVCGLYSCLPNATKSYYHNVQILEQFVRGSPLAAVRINLNHTYYTLLTGKQTVKLRLRRSTCEADAMQ